MEPPELKGQIEAPPEGQTWNPLFFGFSFIVLNRNIVPNVLVKILSQNIYFVLFLKRQ